MQKLTLGNSGVEVSAQAAHDAYQDDATHDKFIEENKANWAGVRVFDSLV